MKFGHSLEHCGRPRVIILGATFRTNNLVDSVLTAGTIECTLHMFAAAETIKLDSVYNFETLLKVIFMTTSKDNWVGIDAVYGNPYNGHTLHQFLEQVERITGWQPAKAYCDRG